MDLEDATVSEESHTSLFRADGFKCVADVFLEDQCELGRSCVGDIRILDIFDVLPRRLQAQPTMVSALRKCYLKHTHTNHCSRGEEELTETPPEVSLRFFFVELVMRSLSIPITLSCLIPNLVILVIS